MPNLTFKPIHLPREIPGCNEFYFMITLAVLLSRIGNNRLFSDAFCALFGVEQIASNLLDLKEQCCAYQPGTIPASLPLLIRENLCVRLANYIQANEALFLDAENPEKLHQQLDAIKQGQAPQALTLKAFAGLLNTEICTYTQEASNLYLSERIAGQPITIHLIRQDQSFQGLIDTSLLPEALIGKMSQFSTYKVAEAGPELTRIEKQVPEQEAITEIKQLAQDYLVRLKHLSFDGDLQFMKQLTVERIIYKAKTLDDIIKILSEQHEFFPSSYVGSEKNYSRAAVLRFNRTPWVVWFIKAFLALLTLPVSIPFFIYWSWRERGTLNFLKPDGSIFMDKVLSVLKRTGLSTNIPNEPKSYTNNTYETSSSLQGAAMQQPTTFTTNPITETTLPIIPRGMERLSTPYNPANAPIEITDEREPYPTLAQEMQGNEAMVGAFTKMFSNHHADVV